LPHAGEPFVSCGANGSVFLRWSARGTTLDVEVCEDGSVDIDENRDTCVTELGSDQNVLASRVRALAAA
jgi:hypothetical protein